MKPRLASNSLCPWGWPLIFLYLLGASILGTYYSAQLEPIQFFKGLYPQSSSSLKGKNAQAQNKQRPARYAPRPLRNTMHLGSGRWEENSMTKTLVLTIGNI